MHWENVIWHVLNTTLVFLVWQLATGTTWRSAFVAGLFALHPAHVESVAWIAERKDVLSAFFWLLGLRAYILYTRVPSRKRYLSVAVFLALGLLSKPMVVTLPLTLLLLDLWPLRRWPKMSWRKLIKEKLPLFALVVVHSIVTLAVQESTGAANYGKRFSLAARLENAAVSTLRYVGKSVWPHPLAPHYDHPGWWPSWTVCGSVAAIALFTALAFWQSKSRPWLAFGWGWFLVTLLPVIGIVQVGAQAMADRYTYVPFLGLFTAGLWAAGEIVLRYPKLRVLAAASAILLLGVFSCLTYQQASAWKDSVELYQRSIASGVDNATIRYLLAVALQSARQPEATVAEQFRRAVALSPDYTNAYTQLALLALNRHDFVEAERLIKETIRLEPRNPALLKNLGVLRNLQGRTDEAAALFAEALRLDPSYTDAHRELSWMYSKQNRPDDALRELETVANASPWDFAVHNDLGTLYLRFGRREEARRSFERALWVNPEYVSAALNLRKLAVETD
jgi:tetratricopeptide (TPR) repeat protein